MVRFFLFLLQSNNLDSVVLNLHGLSVSLVLMAAALESMPGTSQLVIAALHKGTEDGKRREAAALFCWVVGIWGEKLFLLWITECVIQTSGAEWSTSLGAQTEAPCESVAWQAQADVVSQSWQGWLVMGLLLCHRDGWLCDGVIRPAAHALHV